MILVTGVTSGLGKYLVENLNADGWRRGQPLPKRHYDTIIHCAHDREHPWANLDMVQRLFSVPCDRFVYLSSLDVHKAHTCDNHGYGMSKLRCEAFVRTHYDDHLIIRPGVIIGPHSRENTLLKLLRGKKLSVTPDSTFGVTRHATLLPVLAGAEQGIKTITGTVMTVKDIGEEMGLCPEYGDFPYETPHVKPTHDTMAEVIAEATERNEQ